MTVTGCSTVLGEIGVLRACADALNETAAASSEAGGINALSWGDALHALDGLRIAVETLAQIDAALVRHLYLRAPHGDVEVDGIGVVNISRSKDRKEWEHDEWKKDVRGALLEKTGVPDHLYDTSGNEVDVLELLARCQNIHGAQAPKVTALRALGLDPQAYCHEVPGKPTVTITRSRLMTNADYDAPGASSTCRGCGLPIRWDGAYWNADRDEGPAYCNPYGHHHPGTVTASGKGSE